MEPERGPTLVFSSSVDPQAMAGEEWKGEKQGAIGHATHHFMLPTLLYAGSRILEAGSKGTE
jgi:hypothetical protein